MATARTHYLADIAAGEVPRGAACSVYRALWAMCPNPFDPSPIVNSTTRELASITKLTTRSVIGGVESLAACGLVNVRKRKGRSSSYQLVRPLTSASEIDGPFTFSALVMTIAPEIVMVGTVQADDDAD